MYIKIPRYNTEEDKWSYQEFETRDEYKAFVWSKFKPPGEVKLYNTKSGDNKLKNLRSKDSILILHICLKTTENIGMEKKKNLQKV